MAIFQNTASLQSIFSPLKSFFWIACTLFVAGCGSTVDFSALEDDELYLKRGEEFITDAMYLEFAFQQAGMESEAAENDYYDPERSAYSPGYMGYGYGMPGYQSSFNNPYRPFSNGIGLNSYFNPMGGTGWNMGYGGMGYGGMGYGMGYGMGNAYNGGWGGYGMNPYGYNGWNNGWNNGYGYNGWNNGYGNPYVNNGNGGDTFGGYGNGFTGLTRTPIMSYTSNGSNYDSSGVLARPKTEEEDLQVDPSATERITPSPTYVAPNPSSRVNRWMSGNSSGVQEQPRTREQKREWSLPESSPSSWGNSNRSNSTTAPSNNTRSNSSGNSRSNGGSSSSSRSSRGGGL